MSGPRKQTGIGGVIYLFGLILAGVYFTFASVQGDYGLFRRIRIEAEAQELRAEQARLMTEIEALENKTRRISDRYLDLDLLDAQAREVLGLTRADEIVLR
ncbi:FtsB family cell division protein [Maritimibacter dapengensis]|uniref:Septum formation initiator family protein n=1 Tax=Maritimibacter dapengensis TaxID=2836868 RepID=A0ABS6SZE3_9RHOB|nr:septum formation initiator family protein [Maritimibacter dapengensis]MBV7378351.1 septum formation initiator family protein [Maritimibacter dapengensis]